MSALREKDLSLVREWRVSRPGPMQSSRVKCKITFSKFVFGITKRFQISFEKIYIKIIFNFTVNI